MQPSPVKPNKGEPVRSMHAWLLTVPEKRLTPEHRDLLRPRDVPVTRWLWQVYIDELAPARRASMGGVEPIGFDQVMAWEQCFGRRLLPWQKRALFKIDAAFREAARERG